MHIPLPKSMTIEEVEVIQERLNREAAAKTLRGHGADPTVGVIERMRKR